MRPEGTTITELEEGTKGGQGLRLIQGMKMVLEAAEEHPVGYDYIIVMRFELRFKVRCLQFKVACHSMAQTPLHPCAWAYKMLLHVAVGLPLTEACTPWARGQVELTSRYLEAILNPKP